jgi:hypothetical protein
MSFQLPDYAYSLPWYMFDIDNKQLITTQTQPGSISDTKDVILVETPIPGLNYAPIQGGGNGNRKLSFTLKLVRRNNTVGNSLLLQQFAALRNQARDLRQLFSTQFNPNPRVLYNWGTGSLPLIYRVKKCDPTNRELWYNQQGQPQFSEVAFELWLDESHPLYKAEEIYRAVSIYAGQAQAGIDNILSQTGFKVF